MLKTLRGFWSSWSIDSGRGASGPMAGVDGALSTERATMAETPAGLRRRVMDRVYEIEATPQRVGLGWLIGPALAAGLVVVAGAAWLASRPQGSAGSTPTNVAAMFHVPTDPGPMIRLVASSVDAPMLDQAQKMVDDTRRATKVIVRCIPFARGG